MSRSMSHRNAWLGATLLGLILASALPSKAATPFSDLLIQGDFGSGGALANYEWQVNYSSGTQLTGQTLLNAVFGTPVDQKTTYDGYELFKATSTQGSVSYIDFGGGSYFMVGATLGGTTLTMDPSFSPGWNYYVAGGAGSNGSANDGTGQPYASGVWTYSEDGSTTRTEASGSYDAWVFGDTNNPSPPSGVSPAPASFTSATVINLSAAPEPSRAVLLFAGLGLLVFRRARRSAS